MQDLLDLQLSGTLQIRSGAARLTQHPAVRLTHLTHRLRASGINSDDVHESQGIKRPGRLPAQAVDTVARALLRSYVSMLPNIFRNRALGPLGLAVLVGCLAMRPAVTRAQLPADEVRGLWVLRSSLASAQSIQQMVATAQRTGFNTLLVQVRGRGDAYYDGTIDPRAVELEDEPASFDPLALTLATAHAAGLRVHAWVNIDLVSSATLLPRSRTHVIARHPEWLMVPKSLANSLRTVPTDTPAYVGQIARAARAQSDLVEGLYLSPVLPAARDYTVSVVREIASRYALDGIHFDYLRYPNEQFDYSVSSIAAFRAEALASVAKDTRDRLDRNAVASASAWPDGLPEAWAQFRRDRLTELATSLRAAAVTARPGIVVSAAVAPNADEARRGRLQDWRLWARSGIVDALCPMIYTADPQEFATAVSRVKNDSGPAAVWAGIGAFKLTPARATENLRVVRKAGVAGVLFYSYDSLNSGDAPATYFSTIRNALLDLAPAPPGR